MSNNYNLFRNIVRNLGHNVEAENGLLKLVGSDILIAPGREMVAYKSEEDYRIVWNIAKDFEEETCRGVGLYKYRNGFEKYQIFGQD